MTDDDADELVERLRAIAGQVDPPPAAVTAAARAALATRRLDEEFAALVSDSATDTLALVRGGDEPRLLSFEGPTAAVEVQVHDAGGTRALRGLVTGASGEVVVETPAGRRTVPIDAHGWFTADGLAPGLCRLRLSAGTTAITTGWVTL